MLLRVVAAASFSLAATVREVREGKAAAVVDTNVPICRQEYNLISDCEVTRTAHSCNFDISA